VTGRCPVEFRSLRSLSFNDFSNIRRSVPNIVDAVKGRRNVVSRNVMSVAELISDTGNGVRVGAFSADYHQSRTIGNARGISAASGPPRISQIVI